MSRRLVVSWSTGKDAAWALHTLRATPGYEVVGLVTSVVPKFGRVAMHGVRESLALAQAKAAGLPLYNIYLDWPCSNERYEESTRTALEWLKRELIRLKVVLAESPGEGFADDLTGVLREYFTRKHAAPVRAWTTREFTQHFSDEPTAKALVPVFHSCDEVKFTDQKVGLAQRFSTALTDTERVFQACGT